MSAIPGCSRETCNRGALKHGFALSLADQEELNLLLSSDLFLPRPADIELGPESIGQFLGLPALDKTNKEAC